MAISYEISDATLFWYAFYCFELLFFILWMVSECMEYVPNVAELIPDEDADDADPDW